MTAHRRASASLGALCFGNFLIGTGTLIVPGMLPLLADGLAVSLPLAGQLITAFAVTVCIGAPLLAGATSRYDRRALLAAMLALFAAGHFAAALVSSFLPMLLVRVVTSVGAAIFTAQAAAVAALLVPPEARGRAIAFVFLGWSIASVAGLPLGAYVGATWGWRAGFVLVGIASLAGFAAVAWLVPRGLKVQPVDAAMWRAILTHPTLLTVVAVTALSASASFAIFAYFVPAAHAFLGASPELLSALLATFGVAGVAGNALAARYMDRLGPGRLVMVCLLAMMASHLLWPWSQGSAAMVAAVLVAWGLGSFSSNSAQQARLAALAPALAPVSIALNTSAIYLGQAAGTAAAGLVIAQIPGSPGYAALAAVSVPLFLLAIGLSHFASLRMDPQPRGAHVSQRSPQR